MKNFYTRLTLLFLSATLVWSCDVLDQNPEMSITDDQAFVSKSSTQAALTGVYSALQSGNYYGQNYVTLGYLPGDHVEWVGSFNYFQRVDAHRLTADNSTITRVWRAISPPIHGPHHTTRKVT